MVEGDTGLSSKAPRSSQTLSLVPIHLEDLTLSLLLHVLLGQEVLQATSEKGESAHSGQQQGCMGRDCGPRGVRKCLGQCYL